MIALVCVVATALACCGSHVEAGPISQTYSLLSRQDKPVDMAKPNNNSAKLWLTRRKVYLVYRSEKNEIEFGGEAQCVQMKASDFELPKKKYQYNAPVEKLKVWSRLRYRNNETGHMYVFVFLYQVLEQICSGRNKLKRGSAFVLWYTDFTFHPYRSL
ncbi:secreted protein, putative [Ixodes scapularis]|uniref:Secreted protein, putative n=1 Tax=Ixodes scapularis TaxID=6945 RepID=B7Q2K2_IXOSC|nr:secreted protein, putative [Ixodes scapularis]|eukprot:XP_002410860.1 secreted protein, putative [Ixodes scapularis]